MFLLPLVWPCSKRFGKDSFSVNYHLKSNPVLLNKVRLSRHFCLLYILTRVLVIDGSCRVIQSRMYAGRPLSFLAIRGLQAFGSMILPDLTATQLENWRRSHQIRRRAHGLRNRRKGQASAGGTALI